MPGRAGGAAGLTASWEGGEGGAGGPQCLSLHLAMSQAIDAY